MCVCVLPVPYKIRHLEKPILDSELCHDILNQTGLLHLRQQTATENKIIIFLTHNFPPTLENKSAFRLASSQTE